MQNGNYLSLMFEFKFGVKLELKRAPSKNALVPTFASMFEENLSANIGLPCSKFSSKFEVPLGLIVEPMFAFKFEANLGANLASPEILETPVDKAENEFVLEQLEEAVFVQEEELVEDLGDAELPWVSRIEEKSVQDATVDAKEDTVQSPRQVVYEESDGIIQEANSLDDDDHESSSLSDELASASFLRGARPILFIDGCHLSGPYKGTLLVAFTCDANNDLFSITYAIVSAENNENWLWFLSNLKELTGSIPVTLISDRHPSIIAAVEQVYDRDRHAYCYRHVKEIFCAETKKLQREIRGEVKEDAKKLLDAVCYTRFGTEFTKAVEQLRVFLPELANWLETKGDMKKWAKS
ncbi:uncharacterized protein LOC107493302 [Arachis duranensis]|uniref:Uncharacterized protein LOC107493302 n=1 Tax=Arachis duranensis TaxID=130453 RepID=A0A6P5MRR9_ARADU|nr:uncharacterized protein LOC107493302 [Arachis duranensis]